jgi:hypothetical protein
MSAYPLNTNTLGGLLTTHSKEINASVEELTCAVMALGSVLIRASRPLMNETDARDEMERLIKSFATPQHSRP